jgi:RNA polymerase sigma factor (sigma-70 family)
VDLLTQEKASEAVFGWAVQRMSQPDDLEHVSEVWEGTMERAVAPDGLVGLGQRWGDQADPEIWLRLKLKGKLSDYWEAKGRRPLPDEPLERFNPETGRWEPIDVADRTTPEGVFLSREEARVVYELVQGLPPEQREVVELYYFAETGLTQKEIAQRLGVTRETVNHRLNAAYRSLRGPVGDYLCGNREVN